MSGAIRKPLGKKILIVEDDPDYRSILQQAFEREGFQIVLGKDGIEGLVLAQREDLDLIILDILMPKMDGIETAKRIKKLNIKSPIIFLTNLGDMSSINKAMESINSDLDYIVKADMHVSQIIARIKEKLDIK